MQYTICQCCLVLGFLSVSISSVANFVFADRLPLPRQPCYQAEQRNYTAPIKSVGQAAMGTALWSVSYMAITVARWVTLFPHTLPYTSRFMGWCAVFAGLAHSTIQSQVHTVFLYFPHSPSKVKRQKVKKSSSPQKSDGYSHKKRCVSIKAAIMCLIHKRVSCAS